MFTNENNKISLTAESHDAAKTNNQRRDEEVVDGTTKNWGSTPQKNVSFDETSTDNRRKEDKNGELQKL